MLASSQGRLTIPSQPAVSRATTFEDKPASGQHSNQMERRMSVLAVLLTCLSLLAHGQPSIAGFTNPPVAETFSLPKSVPDPLEPLNRVMWSVCRRETRPDRDWQFWPKPHLPGTLDQQFTPGEMARRPG
jgi:hypothetical protein